MVSGACEKSHFGSHPCLDGVGAFPKLKGYALASRNGRDQQVILEFTLPMDNVTHLDIRLYRKRSGGLFGSTGCGPPRWISDNDYYQRLFRHKFKIPPLKV
ncbi:MAG: hypothetical protein BECKG1743D_GA0114223_103472 [Candidatus Kentron sp. G]|nr:MAG: hypothetical protein BECKG1743E_GA0114224_102013 [Candidatus Kentron sp. G]VFN02228.1 MAG: hypothetical protein BECKG1743D_GA0114223_103472 [Candidatus Kentron sp. G]